MDLSYRAIKPEEQDFLYSQSQEIARDSGCIGHLRVDMGSMGHSFHSTWNDHTPIYKSQDIVHEFDDVINDLRFDSLYDGMLTDRSSLAQFCRNHSNAALDDDRREFGFRVNSEDYSYMLRLNPHRGEYAAYIYAYDKELLDAYILEKNGPQLIDVLVVEPATKPYKKQIESGLASLQKEVGGYIEATYPFYEPVAIICNEEGKINGLPLNRALYDDSGKVYDIVAGTFLVVGLTEDDFGSLDDTLMEKFAARFEKAENFAMRGGEILVSPREAVDKWSENTLTIYQMKPSPTTENMLFMSHDYISKRNYSIDEGKYEKVYTGPMKPGESLDDIYTRFNIACPDDFKGHSLSVSDVVVIHDDEKDTAYFVDRFGFKELPDFFAKKEQQLDQNSVGVTFEGYSGTWRVEESVEVRGQLFYLLEHETQRADIPGIIAEPNGKVVLTNVYDGITDYTVELIDVALQPVERMPDPTISIDEMRDYGYPWGGMLPMRMEAAVNAYKNLNLHIYKLYADDTESAVMDEQDMHDHASWGGIFGVEKIVWNHHLEKENALKNAEVSVEDDYNMIDGMINNGEKESAPAKDKKTSVIDKIKSAVKSQPIKKPETEVKKEPEL